jgi:hypothetical protein
LVAAIEGVINNVHPGPIDPSNNLGPNTFPMTAADHSALGDPLEDCTATLTVTDAASPAHAATSTVSVAVSAAGSGAVGDSVRQPDLGPDTADDGVHRHVGGWHVAVQVQLELR